VTTVAELSWSVEVGYNDWVERAVLTPLREI